jgi:hypothetical protein
VASPHGSKIFVWHVIIIWADAEWCFAAGDARTYTGHVRLALSPNGSGNGIVLLRLARDLPAFLGLRCQTNNELYHWLDTCVISGKINPQ